MAIFLWKCTTLLLCISSWLSIPALGQLLSKWDTLTVLGDFWGKVKLPQKSASASADPDPDPHPDPDADADHKADFDKKIEKKIKINFVGVGVGVGNEVDLDKI